MELESSMRAAALKVAGKLLEAKLNDDKSDYHGQAYRCSCGGTVVYRGRREKSFVTVVGEITLERAYYYCHECGNGVHPCDKELELTLGLLSPGVEKMVGASAAIVSFEESHELLRELANVEVETKEIERTAESLGEDIAEDECSYISRGDAPRTTIYLGLDGTWISMRRKGATDEIIGAFTPFKEKHPEATTCINYLETNRERMRYPLFRSLGLCVSSGVEEAGCKVDIGTRLKRAGMHWTIEGANAICVALQQT